MIALPPLTHTMAGIHITDIEAAINHWRIQNPSPHGVSLPPELRALAEVYALMVYHKQDLADEFTLPVAAAEAWQDWYATTPDTPCIAICSTSQGDETCPDGHLKLLHLWPVKLLQAGQPDYDASGWMAKRAAASLSL